MSLTVLLLYGFAFVGLVYSVLYIVIAIRNNHSGEILMPAFVLSHSLIISEYVFYWTGLYTTFPYLNNISLPLLLLFGPLLFIYVDQVYAERFILKKYIWHFLPATMVIVFLAPYYLHSFSIQLFEFRRYDYMHLITFIPYFIILNMVFYVVLIHLRLKAKENLGHIKTWLRILNFLYFVYCLCYIFYYTMANRAWFNITTDYFISFSSCLIIIVIIYLSLIKDNMLNGFTTREALSLKKNNWQNKDFLIQEIEVNDETSSFIKYKNSGLTDSTRDKLAIKLEDLMIQEKLYRSSDIKLETIAEKLNVEKHYVSQIINQSFGVNFFEYINKLRIEEAKELLLNPDFSSSNVIEIAYQVGYNTKNTFNNAFKRMVGKTPSEFRKKE